MFLMSEQLVALSPVAHLLSSFWRSHTHPRLGVVCFVVWEQMNVCTCPCDCLIPKYSSSSSTWSPTEDALDYVRGLLSPTHRLSKQKPILIWFIHGNVLSQGKTTFGSQSIENELLLSNQRLLWNMSEAFHLRSNNWDPRKINKSLEGLGTLKLFSPFVVASFHKTGHMHWVNRPKCQRLSLLIENIFNSLCHGKNN